MWRSDMTQHPLAADDEAGGNPIISDEDLWVFAVQCHIVGFLIGVIVTVIVLALFVL
jgi:hypothetical protein